MIDKLIAALVSILIVCSFGACNDAGTNALIPGTYLYSAYDSAKVPLVEGTLILIINDSSITGTWEITKINDAKNTGPQIGAGYLRGTIHDGELDINLNPEWVDDNVVLLGKIEQGAFRGRWSWSTLIGPTSGGTFIARKAPYNIRKR